MADNEGVRVYTDGVFDLMHFGHMRLFEHIKTRMFPPTTRVTLVVGIHGDDDVVANKGPPLMTYAERVQTLPHVRWVDEVVERAPWRIDAAFLAEHAIDFVARDGAPYPSREGDDLDAVPRALGIFLSCPRTPCVSTTDIIQRVLDCHETYVERNRQRGTPAPTGRGETGAHTPRRGEGRPGHTRPDGERGDILGVKQSWGDGYTNSHRDWNTQR
jgi:choline-phosphate cytidylyltransferase